MRRSILFFIAIGLCFCLPSIAKARQTKKQKGVTQTPVRKGPPATTIEPVTAQPLKSEEAFAVLKELNDKGTLGLVIAGEMGRLMGVTRHAGLAAENCFGWRLAGGKRVLGESSGGFYGLNLKSSEGKEFENIGFIHSETDLLIEGKSVKAGTYTVFAATDTLAFDTKEKGGFAEVFFPLKQSLDPSLFSNQKGGKSPRHSLTFQGGSLWIVVANNKLRVSPTSQPLAQSDSHAAQARSEPSLEEIRKVTDQTALAEMARTAKAFDTRLEAARRIHDAAVLAEVLKQDTAGRLREALERLPWRITGEIWVTNSAYPEGAPAVNEVYFIPYVEGAPRIDKFNGKVLNPSGGTVKGRFVIELLPNTIAPSLTNKLAVGQEFTLGWPKMVGRRRPDGTFAIEVLPIINRDSVQVVFKVEGFTRTVEVGRINTRY